MESRRLEYTAELLRHFADLRDGIQGAPGPGPDAVAGSSLADIGFHRRRSGLGQKDDSDTHHGKGDRRHGQYRGTRLETLVEQPHAQGNADDGLTITRNGWETRSGPT